MLFHNKDYQHGGFKMKIEKLFVPSYMYILKTYSDGKYAISEVVKMNIVSRSMIDNINLIFEKEGIITYENKDGRSKYVILTEKGKQLAENITSLFTLLNIPPRISPKIEAKSTESQVI